MPYSDEKNPLFISYNNGDCTYDEVEAYRNGYQQAEKDLGWHTNEDPNTLHGEFYHKYLVKHNGEQYDLVTYECDDFEEWYETKGEEAISPEEITHWMEIPEVKE